MERQRGPVWLDLVAGVGGAAVGLLPWLVTGLHLPVQNLWEVETISASMPRGLLPLSQYYFLTTAALLITGGAVTGVVGRLLRRHVEPRRAVAMLTLAAVQMLAVVQSAGVLGSGLEQSRRATLYLSVIVAAAILSVITSVLVAGLLSAPSRTAAVVGTAIAAVLVPSWLGTLVFPPGSMISDNASWFLPMMPWVAPVLVGAAIAWGGLGGAARITAALVALVAVWVGPGAVTAISSAAGSRVLARYPAEMAAYAGEVFVAALTQPVLVLRSLGAAVAVALIGLLLRRLLSARGPRSVTP